MILQFEKKMTFLSQKGIALVMVLWVLTILMVVAFSFSFTTRTETHSAMHFRDGIEKKFLSEAGIERGIMELFYRKQNRDVEGSEVWKTNGASYDGRIGEGRYTVRITDESGKVDINRVPDIILKNLLYNLGINGDDVDIIVDSIMDWKDSDDLVRLHGTESNYYRSLPNPYRAKNGDFDTLEELLLVRGVTPEILYGSAEKKGIITFLTVYSMNSSINVNAAPKEVLMAIPGMTATAADAIINFREGKEIRSVLEVQAFLGETFNIAAPYIRAGDSDVFAIVATGYKGSDKNGYSTAATVAIKGNDKYSFVYYKSPANSVQ